jgi:hypothetical protein
MKIHESIDYIREHAEHLGDKKKLVTLLTEFRKSKKAILMRNAFKSGFEAANAQEREAYSDPEYILLINELADAVGEYETEKWKMLAEEMAIEVWRSEEATNRMVDRAHA